MFCLYLPILLRKYFILTKQNIKFQSYKAQYSEHLQGKNKYLIFLSRLPTRELMKWARFTRLKRNLTQKA